MKRRTQQSIAAFIITVIVIGALCGFVAVDISTERYMPGEYTRLFEITEITPQGMRLSLLGRRYLIDPGLLDPAREFLYEYRGFLPSSVLISANLTAQGYMAAVDYLEENKPVEEPW